MPVTRLAPSPTGALHLGNARTFLVNWALAKQRGWRILLRIEDLDTPRVKPHTVAETIDLLAWLGLTWDEGPVTQSDDLSPYGSALQRLIEAGAAYRCACTRRDIEAAASAPQLGDHELRYPGTCRNLAGEPISDTPFAYRFRVPDGPVRFTDEWLGEQTIDVQREVGDFVIRTKAGLPAYQLAVVVDDARQGVTDIVRGYDLLSSAARQRLLYRVLGLAPLPHYYHLPLVLGPDGRRLAKRHGDTRLTAYRDGGTSAARVVGLLAYWSGVTAQREGMTASDFAGRFDLARLPTTPATFTPEDHAWLAG